MCWFFLGGQIRNLRDLSHCRPSRHQSLTIGSLHFCRGTGAKLYKCRGQRPVEAQHKPIKLLPMGYVSGPSKHMIPFSFSKSPAAGIWNSDRPIHRTQTLLRRVQHVGAHGVCCATVPGLPYDSTDHQKAATRWPWCIGLSTVPPVSYSKLAVSVYQQLNRHRSLAAEPEQRCIDRSTSTTFYVRQRCIVCFLTWARWYMFASSRSRRGVERPYWGYNLAHKICAEIYKTSFGCICIHLNLYPRPF